MIGETEIWQLLSRIRVSYIGKDVCLKVLQNVKDMLVQTITEFWRVIVRNVEGSLDKKR